MGRIAVTDGMSPAAVSLLEKSGHEVIQGYIEEEDLTIPLAEACRKKL